MQKIPGLNDLRIFEAAGRLQNFRLAGQELSLTHSAVSHRIRSLEEQLRLELFERQNGVRLTDAGRELHAAVTLSLDQLGAAIDRISQHHRSPRQVVRIASLPAFAAYWLLPRLHDFYLTHPDISLQIQASIELAELGENGVDLALRFLGKNPGAGNAANVQVHKLLDDYYYPVASPDFIARHQPALVEDLLTLPLLVHANTIGAGSSWSAYFKALGLPAQQVLRSISFDDGNLVLQAAEHGHGIAFERHSHVCGRIRQGYLQRVFDSGLHSQKHYYLLSTRQGLNITAVKCVHDWLISQAQEFVQQSGPELAQVQCLNLSVEDEVMPSSVTPG
ncbi:LysR substrate-binding domain-containing protein [Undibacterium umbellatum]|uniref:LysR family transcriptional regulator n=1 Tax=Undibacterium umbellatum TaxID=2762300 RepID=A0ABR6Z915_9BURK|nr:LysR substrate-binding domain-containing protein [Undibacterium umbellatum]MBC3907825.1 LysR family transcriptional regulator [Undibacterium umbellatum]